MFGSYIKNLNEMVFPTTDGSEEPSSSSSVLGRLGSWLWARSPISSTDAASPTSPGSDRPGAPSNEPDSLSEDVFYPVPQQDEDTPEDEWEEASSSFQSGTAGRFSTRFPPEPPDVPREPGKRLHVYLEETSVGGSAGQEVVCKFSKSLQVRPKSRSSVSVDSERGHSFSTALVGVSLNAQKTDATETGDGMGRRNARRKYRKNSQESGSEAADKDKLTSPKSTTAGPAPGTGPAPSEASPERQKSHSSSLNSGQACGSERQAEASTEARQAEASTEARQAEASMEADDSFYRVERRTETPESKRRSIKVSKSQIKLFTKNVPLQPRSNTEVRSTRLTETPEEVRSTRLTETPEEVRSTRLTRDEADSRLKDAKKPEKKPKPAPAPGRIADKISLFENRKLGESRLFDAPRSADVSPIRKPTGRLKAEQALSELRSRSDECLDRKRSSSTSPPRHKGLTIQERVRNFTDACETAAAASPKPSVSRVHHKITASRSLDILDAPDQEEKAVSKAETVDQKDQSKDTTLEPSISRVHRKVTASRSLDMLDGGEKTTSKATLRLGGADAEAKAGRLKAEVVDQKDQSNDANDLNKAPTRAASRSKKRRSKEPASPKTEQTLGVAKQEADSVDGKENGVSVTDASKFEEATSGHDTTKKKGEVERIGGTEMDKRQKDASSATTKEDKAEREGKIQFTSKTVKETPSSKTKLDVSTAKKEASSAKMKKDEAESKGKTQSTGKKVETPSEASTKAKLDVSAAKNDATTKKGKIHSLSKKVEEAPPESSTKVKLDASAAKKDDSSATTKKDEAEMSEKNQTTHKKVEETPSESSTKSKEVVIADIQNHDEIIPSLSEKSSAEDSSKGQDVKVGEKLNEKELVMTAESESEGKASSETQGKEAVCTSDKAAAESKETRLENEKAPTLQQGGSIVQHKASDKTTGSEDNLCSVKQAAPSDIDQTLPRTAERREQTTEKADKIKENVAQEATSGEKLESGAANEAVKGENKLDLSGIKAATGESDKQEGDRIEVCKSLDENKAKPVVPETQAEGKALSEVSEGNTTKGQQTVDEKATIPETNLLVPVTSGQTETQTELKVLSEQTKEISEANKAQNVSEGQKNVDKTSGRTEAQAEIKVSSEQTKEISEGSLSKNEPEVVQENVGEKAQSDKSQEKAGQEKSAPCKPETDTSEETKAPTDKSPTVLPPNDQEITAPFTGRSDSPATAQTTDMSKASEAEVAATGLIKQRVIENGGKPVRENESEAFGKQSLGNEKAKSGQEAGVSSLEGENVEKSENSPEVLPNNAPAAEESVRAEHGAVSVEDNEGEREGRTHTITGPESAQTHGTETEPEPQAESATAEKKSQTRVDDSAAAKSDISEQKAAVDQVRGTDGGEKGSNNLDDSVGGGKSSTERPKLARDLIRQAGSEFEKAITNRASERISPTNELRANGDVTASPANKTSSKTTTKSSDSPRKRLNFPKGLSKDDWGLGQRQDAPSSWLDVDVPKQKQKLRVLNEAKLTSSGSESNLLDTSADLDDEDFVEKIKKLCAPFQLPPRKHNHLRHPQPPFAMPAIKEDRFEKTFDPDEFTFGLRKKSKFSLETPSLMAKLQSSEVKSAIKPARASLADRSMLLGGLERLRDKSNGKDEQEDEAKDEIKVKSRLEGSCVLNSLTTSSFRSKLSPSPAQGESAESGNVSPSNGPQTQSAQQQGPPTNTDPEEEKPSAGQSDSGPPLPAFDRIKLPSFLEKFRPREAQSGAGRELATGAEAALKQETLKESAQNPPAELQVSTKTESKMPSVKEETQDVPDFPQQDVSEEAALKQDAVKESAQNPPGERQVDSKVAVKMPAVDVVELKVKEEQKPPESVTNHFAGISLKDKAPPRRRPSKKVRSVRGFHRRPGKMLLFEKAGFEGQVYEVHRDLEDASALLLSSLISVRVVRGCWVLYERPGFQGRTIALEEGSLELTNVWAEPGPDPETPSDAPLRIGSIRLAVSDYSIPHIDLFTEPEGRGRVTPYHDDSLETGSFGIPLNTASIQVHSGVWLVFSDPGFQGMLAVLEPGGYPFPETWGFPSPFVGSLRPLKMGGFKVENPNEIKAVVFQKAGFKGRSLELEADVFSFGDEDGGDEDGGDEDGGSESADPTALQSVESLKVHGGLWVGYSEPGFEGQQYVLEEGEYLDCGDWGGAEILSIRPIMNDFMSPHLRMFSDRDFGKLGVNIDLTVPVINLDETGYGLKTQSMDVLSGAWVVFEEPGFCGESYIVEKGQYGSPEDWGASRACIASAMPVVLENFENTAKFKVQLFSEADLRGSCLILEDSEGSLPDGFSVASCKVLAGSWLAFEGRDFSGRMYVLDEGTYPDLRAMGCAQVDASILSLQIVGFEFSAPSIVLFERSGLKGKRVALSGGVVNLQMSGGGGRVQSVLVEGGMWVLYEEINFRGAQILLRPGEVSDWRSLCPWRKIGSLRPLLQKQVPFHLRNRLSGRLMTVTGDMDDIKLLRVQEMEDTQGFEQIWFFQDGHLRCKLLEECCLSPSSSVTMAGARVGLAQALDEDTHLWSISPEGHICCREAPGLVLEVKGGHNYDKSLVVLNTRDPGRPQQQWLVEVL